MCEPNPCAFNGECTIRDSNTKRCRCSEFDGYDDDCDGMYSTLILFDISVSHSYKIICIIFQNVFLKNTSTTCVKYQPVKSLVSRHLLMNIHAIVTKSLTIVTVRKHICDVNVNKSNPC